MKSDSRIQVKGEWVNLEKFIIHFMDGSEQEHIVHPMAIERLIREISDTSKPVFEVKNWIYYKDKIKSFEF